MVIATTAAVTSKGQMTLPKEMREHLKIHAGDRVSIVMKDDRIVITPKISLDELCNVLPPPLRSATLEEIDRAGEAMAVERFKRTQ